MNNNYFSLGLMSGTSMDGVDASIIQSNGAYEYKTIFNEYMQYDKNLYKKLNIIRDKISTPQDLNLLSGELKLLEKEITLFHVELANKIIKKKDNNVHLIGFHGQTIFHNANYKISKQLGDGNLLSKLTKKTVVYDFRKNDLKNGGQGAPLTPIFHTTINKKINDISKSFLNIGGIANETIIFENGNFSARDIGPGNCLIDRWIKLKSEKIFDKNGDIARSGKINKTILNQSLAIFNKNISQKRSYDISDFDLSLIKDLSLEDGAATITEFTSEILSKKILNKNIYVCGGGRKNKFLIESIENKIKSKIKLIDEIDIDGDFVESQAFAYLAIRSYLGLPISFPETTGCKEPCTGGVIVKNF